MDFDCAIAELDTLVETLEREGDERALHLLQLIDAIHRPGLELIVAGDLEHPVARALLAMYDLAALDERLQVEEALDLVRPYIHSHDGELELLDVEDGVVHLRLTGACHGCSGSAMTLRRGVEEVLREHYPSFREIVAHEPDGQLLQIASLRRPVFVEAGAAEDLAPGELRPLSLDGLAILLANVQGEIYAFRNGCPVDGLPLEGGRLTEAVLVCPWHNCAFDARTGKRVDDQSEPGLAVVPVAIEDGVVRVAVNVA
ncbi:NifU-like domain [Gaiella occulta]|uniref:NifU-like domain n=1 Tax=Gaiella occulta TaxID=1002870 RepID=A0A7M2Z099_9ACTN|nr:NifU family protein [Gaiella occulta]RDI75838.1 NifU-like domain [Gaiella occulta]